MIRKTDIAQECSVVIVESPAKAKTISKYLGENYNVIACFGHIRELPARDGSVCPEQDFLMRWQPTPQAKKHIHTIIDAVKKAKYVYLTTDPDREGEAIAWHIQAILEQEKLLKNIELWRISFNEITKDVLKKAFQYPRQIDLNLVDAYRARRALDYLVGFTLSPLLWRKLPGTRSAGRVQSVALRLICERETEIETFRKQEYWSIEADFGTPERHTFTTQLKKWKNKTLKQFDIPTQEYAQTIVSHLKCLTYRITDVQEKTIHRHPAAPFTTSSLQQEASRKFHLSVSRTMHIAQRLYEGIEVLGDVIGLITYMRTDSVHLSSESVTQARQIIQKLYGPDYVPKKKPLYKSKVKNAQEAHEAIRPTNLNLTPERLTPYLEKAELQLYTLIWNRTLASQMSQAVFQQVTVTVAACDKSAVFKATGTRLVFSGFLKVYGEEPCDDPKKDQKLPDLKPQTLVTLQHIQPNQHFTQPPARYTEASMVKKLEELGIGRPSTYATILKVIQDRNYAFLQKKAFYPEPKGRVLTIFLLKFFQRYVEYTFTAELEDQLDEVAKGLLQWNGLLQNFWQHFSPIVEKTKALRISEVIDVLNKEVSRHFFFLPREQESDTSHLRCPLCSSGVLSIKFGKAGPFMACSQEKCYYTDSLKRTSQEQDLLLGVDPKTSREISLRHGPYGFYVQSTPKHENGSKPYRVALPKKWESHTVSLDIALQLLEMPLPRKVGIHPETGEEISVNIGRFGPYITYKEHHKKRYVSLPKNLDILNVTLQQALEVLNQKPKKKK